MWSMWWRDWVWGLPWEHSRSDEDDIERGRAEAGPDLRSDFRQKPKLPPPQTACGRRSTVDCLLPPPDVLEHDVGEPECTEVDEALTHGPDLGPLIERQRVHFLPDQRV